MPGPWVLIVYSRDCTMPEQFTYPYVTRCQDTDDHQNLPNSLINTGGIWGKEVWETVVRAHCQPDRLYSPGKWVPSIHLWGTILAVLIHVKLLLVAVGTVPWVANRGLYKMRVRTNAHAAPSFLTMSAQLLWDPVALISHHDCTSKLWAEINPFSIRWLR